MESSDEDIDLTIKEENVEELLSWENANYSAFAESQNVTTVLTNLQRGNIESKAPQFGPKVSFHMRAAMGELTNEDFTPETDVNNPDEYNLTPLMWAAAYGQLPTAKLLISKQAEIEYKDDEGDTATFFAASRGHHEVVRLLLTSGANPNHEDDVGNTALMYAAKGDNPHCISELLEHGADLTTTNVDGQSAYNLALSNNCKQAQTVIEKFMLRLLESS